MKITHSIDQENFVSKECADKNLSIFMLSKLGNYFSIPANPKNNISNYSGYVLSEKNRMFKTIENIHLRPNNAYSDSSSGNDCFIPEEIFNNFTSIERRYKMHLEKFVLLRNGLMYCAETDSENGVKINISLDFRDVNDYGESGRIYKIHKSDNSLIVEYTKYADDSLRETIFKKVLIIHGVNDSYELPDTWLKRNYSYDESRNSKSEFYVYDALSIVCKHKCELIIACGDNYSDAMEKITDIMHNHKMIEKIHNNYLENELMLKHNISEVTGEDIAFGYVNSVHALDGLMVSSKNIKGIWAGLPWFFQYWSRDELISLKALILMDKREFSKNILLRHLNAIQKNGRIPNIYTSEGYSGLGSADSIGWLFKRIKDIILLIEKDEFKNYFNLYEINYIREKLAYSINQIMNEHYHEGFIENGPLETWMDTNFGNDTREGARIEIQCAFLCMLNLMNTLNQLLANKFVKKDKKLVSVTFQEKDNSIDNDIDNRIDNHIDYHKMEREFSMRVRERFFINGYLNDGWKCSNAEISRPNIFLAYYLYPELLSCDDWEKAFDNSIKRLWVSWDVGKKDGGGFSTIDLENPLYTPKYTGQNNKSYHRGDSWFFLNNIAAICLYNLNKEKYFSYVKKILNASTEDMLYKGFIGYSSEVTSSSIFEPGGCFCQAWSIATYIELINEMFII
ncbi:MAG: amylo-alpha-1,6-glucosidase [Candidatus Woesearchaeota archaeon]